MKRVYWSRSMDEFLREHYPHLSATEIVQRMKLTTESQVYRRAAALGLRKSREWIAERGRLRMSDPSHPAYQARFKPGLKPWNLGTKGLVGTQPGCKATQFKPGNKPHTWMPMGSFRVTPDGILEQKFSDNPGPPTARWKAYARIVWENKHGPVPSGHVVVFRAGKQTTDPAQVTLDRLECISRHELMRRNSRHNLPPELNELVSLRATLTRTIKTKAKEADA